MNPRLRVTKTKIERCGIVGRQDQKNEILDCLFNMEYKIVGNSYIAIGEKRV